LIGAGTTTISGCAFWGVLRTRFSGGGGGGGFEGADVFACPRFFRGCDAGCDAGCGGGPGGPGGGGGGISLSGPSGNETFGLLPLAFALAIALGWTTRGSAGGLGLGTGAGCALAFGAGAGVGVAFGIGGGRLGTFVFGGDRVRFRRAFGSKDIGGAFAGVGGGAFAGGAFVAAGVGGGAFAAGPGALGGAAGGFGGAFGPGQAPLPDDGATGSGTAAALAAVQVFS
jgi:hypothetical protein